MTHPHDLLSKLTDKPHSSSMTLRVGRFCRVTHPCSSDSPDLRDKDRSKLARALVSLTERTAAMSTRITDWPSGQSDHVVHPRPRLFDPLGETADPIEKHGWGVHDSIPGSEHRIALGLGATKRTIATLDGHRMTARHRNMVGSKTCGRDPSPCTQRVRTACHTRKPISAEEQGVEQ